MYNLKEIMYEVYQQDFAEFDNPTVHFFSRRHRKAMKEILYPCELSSYPVNRKVSPKKRVIIAIMVILLSALAITAGASIVNGFLRKEHSDNTELFTPAAVNCPLTIEKVYYLPNIPEGYISHETVSDDWRVYTSYINSKTERCLVLSQSVKGEYKSSVDNERHSLEEVDINGHYGLYLGNHDVGVIIWDNDDYILEVTGDFNKDELIILAKSAKV